MKGSEILLTAAQPRGVFLEGLLAANQTPYPGSAMMIVAGAALVNGEPTWTPYAPSADGDPRLAAILLPDSLQGQLYSTAYASPGASAGGRVFLYCPLAGEYMNIAVAPQVGTGSANAYTIGERMIPSHSTAPGQFIQTSTSSVQAWFMSMEHYDATADAVGWLFSQKQF